MRRARYTRLAYEDEQRLLEFSCPDTVLYTKLGQGGPIDGRLQKPGCLEWTTPERIIESHHRRGRDELVYRTLKDFRAEQLPLGSSQANAAFYYTVLVAFFLFEASKRDVTDVVVPLTACATRVRRQGIDLAAKIVRTSGEIFLKVTPAVWNRLQIEERWARSGDPPHPSHANAREPQGGGEPMPVCHIGGHIRRHHPDIRYAQHPPGAQNRPQKRRPPVRPAPLRGSRSD